jgi:hypothetical protein
MVNNLVMLHSGIAETLRKGNCRDAEEPMCCC